jgi:hypothetical protein
MRLKMGKRVHLCEYETEELADDLNQFFERIVEVSRIKHGKRDRDSPCYHKALDVAEFEAIVDY